MAPTNTSVEAVGAAEAASTSSAASVAKFAASGIGLGVLAMIGVDAYNGIKSLFQRKVQLQQATEAQENAMELKIRRSLDRQSRARK